MTDRPQLLSDDERAALIAAQQAIVDNDVEYGRLIEARNALMRKLRELHPERGAVTEMAEIVSVNRVTASGLVNPSGRGSGRRQPNRRRAGTGE